MATELNIEIDQGATWTKRMSWQDAELNVYDLSSHSARMQIRKNYADLDKSEPLLSLTSDGEGIVLGDGTDDNNIVITITAEQTQAIPFGQYYYDLELEDGNNSVLKILRGKVLLLGEVTR